MQKTVFIVSEALDNGGVKVNSVDAIEGKEMYKQIQKRLRCKHPKYAVMIAVGVDTGLRISDILQLKVCDIKPKFTVTEKKTKKKRQVQLSRKTRLQIQKYTETCGLSPNDYLIYSRDWKKDKPLHRTQAWRVIHAVGADLGNLSVGTHSMRKTYAVNQYRLKQSVKAVQEDFNHKNINTTYGYLIKKQNLDNLLPE